jgi:hypothetical protein
MADFWCVVALSYDRSEAFVIARSDDVAHEMLFDQADYNYQYGDDWVQDHHRPGLYRLTVKFPIYDDGGIDFDADFTYESVECLVEFPEVFTKAADEFEIIRRNMVRIARSERAA